MWSAFYQRLCPIVHWPESSGSPHGVETRAHLRDVHHTVIIQSGSAEKAIPRFSPNPRRHRHLRGFQRIRTLCRTARRIMNICRIDPRPWPQPRSQCSIRRIVRSRLQIHPTSLRQITHVQGPGRGQRIHLDIWLDIRHRSRPSPGSVRLRFGRCLTGLMMGILQTESRPWTTPIKTVLKILMISPYSFHHYHYT